MWPSRGSEGATAEPVVLRSASSRPSGSKPRVSGDLGGDRLPDGWDVLEPEGDRLARARIKESEGHGNLLLLIPVSLETARSSVNDTTQVLCDLAHSRPAMQRLELRGSSLREKPQAVWRALTAHTNRKTLRVCEGRRTQRVWNMFSKSSE
jgi:hypothetical protein